MRLDPKIGKRTACVAGLTLVILLAWHFDKIMRVRNFLYRECELAQQTPVWGESQDGVQVSLKVLGVQEIEGCTGGAIETDAGGTWVTGEWYKYPPAGTPPHLFIQAFAKNVSDKTVYLIGDKSRNGTEKPAFSLIRILHGNDPPRQLNLRTGVFYRQNGIELRPGATTWEFENVPYDSFAPSAPDVKIQGSYSTVDVRPQEGQVVKADHVAYSNEMTPPWDLLRLYFDTINW